MKVLIWIFVAVVFTPVFGLVNGVMFGYRLGAIPVGILTAVACIFEIMLAKHLCNKWDKHKFKSQTTFTFKAHCTRTDGSSIDTSVTLKLNKEAAKRLIFYGIQKNVYDQGFVNCKGTKDLYDMVYTIAVDQMTKELRALIERGYEEEYEANDPDWKVDDTYYCIVHFPKEFEDYI